MIKQAIAKLVNKESLSFAQAKEVFEEIFNHKVSDAQIAAFLTALKMKEEKEDEIWAAATVIRNKSLKINVKKGFLGIEDKEQPIIDTCGTGGSGINKFNISTATGFVVAASGVKVAKHGNRAMSSNCGSADVLEAMGINFQANPLLMEEAIRKINLGFLYAPAYHSALKIVAEVRKDIGTRTIFNVLGPLCNPALANYQLLGVYSPELTVVLAKVLRRLGTKKAFVVYSKDLGDEVSLSGKTDVAFLNNKRITKLSLSPASFGLKKCKVSDLLVKNAKVSAKVIRGIFKGEKTPARDIVLANAAVCFYILGKAINLKEGAKTAALLIDQGKANDTFLKFKSFLNKTKK